MLHNSAAKIQQLFEMTKSFFIFFCIFAQNSTFTQKKFYFLRAARASCRELKMFCQMMYAAAPIEDIGLR